MKQSKEEHRFIDHGKHRISHIPFWSLLYRQPCSVVHSIIHIPFHEYLKTNKKNKKSRRNASNCSTYFLQASSTHEQLHEWNVKLSMSASASEEIDGGSNASDWHSEWHHCFWCQSAVDRAFSWTMSASSFQQKSAKVEVNVWWESFLSCVRMPLLAGNWQHHHEFLQWYLHTSDWVNSFQEINRHRQQSTMSRSRISEAKVAIFLFLAVSKSSHQSLEAICTPFVVDDLSELHICTLLLTFEAPRGTEKPKRSSLRFFFASWYLFHMKPTKTVGDTVRILLGFSQELPSVLAPHPSTSADSQVLG